MRLSEINKRLDERIVGQSLAKKMLLASLYNNHGGRILLSGPSGCGKTCLIESISDILGVKCCHVDASKLTQTGFAGNTIEDYISEFINVVDGNLSILENSFIFIDEFDKIQAKRGNALNNDIANLGVQYELLKLFDGGEIVTEYNHRKVTINTQKMTIICAGAFSYNDKTIEDKNSLVECGFIEELAGRINVYIVMDKLTEQDMLMILNNRNNHFVNQIYNSFNELGEEFIIGEEEMREIAKRSADSPFGVRYLEDLLYRRMVNQLYEVMIKHDVEIGKDDSII